MSSNTSITNQFKTNEGRSARFAMGENEPKVYITIPRRGTVILTLKDIERIHANMKKMEVVFYALN